MNKDLSDLIDLIRFTLRPVIVGGKIGQKMLQPLIAEALEGHGLDVDVEDTLSFMRSNVPAWRDRENEQIVPTPGRRRIDIVVRNFGEVIALIETESDLNDLRETGISKRSGHYDVASIARNSGGNFFSSYKSLERMAVAAYCAGGGSIHGLEQVRSDDPAVHNPSAIGLILVTGKSRPLDRRILQPRLQSLDAHLISVVEAQ